MLLPADRLQLQLLHLLLQLLVQVHLLLLVLLQEQTGLDVVQGKQIAGIATGDTARSGSGIGRHSTDGRLTAYGGSRRRHQQRMGRLRWVAKAGSGHGTARARYPRDFNVVGEVLILLAQKF